MELFDIKTLVIDDAQGGLYDLFAETFYLRELATIPHLVTKEQEMRIDLISDDIYMTTEYCDFLLNINDIDNPLNVMSGDILYYVDVAFIDTYRVTTKEAATRNILLSPNKTTKKDSNRQDYIENNYQLPPTFLDTPQSPISRSGTNTIISPLK